MSSRKLDGVHSLSAILEKQGQEAAKPKSKFARSTQTKKAEKFDPRAQESDSDDSSSNSDSSDDDGPANPDFFAKINGQMASSKSASTPLKKAKRDKADEVADSDVENKTSTAKPPATKKAPVKPESSSEESSADEAAAESDSSTSDSDSESEPTAKKPAQNATKTPVANGASTTSSSDSGSDAESEAEKTTKPKAKSAVNGAKAPEPASTSSSDAGSTSGEESAEDKADEEEESSSDEEEPERQTAAVAPRRNSNDLNVPGFVGKDFILRQAQGDEDGKDMTDFFTKAKLEGKQLWYFTAPASIPINIVEKLQIPLDKAHKGDAIFKHNSEDYTVGFDVGATAVELLLPNKKGNRYETAPKKVDKVLHVKRVTQLVGSESSAPRPIQPNLPRPQPQGLRARFHPIGVPDDTPLGKIGFDESYDEDVEMTSTPALPTRTKKPKHTSTQPAAPAGDAMDIDEPTPKSKKKDKKKSKAAKDPVQGSQSTIIEVPDSQPLPTTKEKQSKKRRDSIESISSVGSNPKPTMATPSQSKKPSKRKLPTDEESTPAQSIKEKAKKVKRDASSQDTPAQGSAKKVTAIPPPTVPKPGFSFSGLPAASSPAPETSTPKPKSKSSKKSKADEPASIRKETPILPPSIRRESAVPIPQFTSKSSPAAEETPKKEKRKKRKSDKTEEPKSSKKETPVPLPGSA
ncbi:DNA-directed RNA polymerase I subunit RPA34.5-domain-containing protein [Colletotrichum phormii]|uniref:DNA-directed RNA polymerase I subunit RPA34.5-domain-containing protein n=1 Tax=Colletotrichum phormii TaxID=359342 RepID=A0AAI9ZXN6_9PEZI|nr:DNA-directed RNA polymerase I subunit RPA34.5-domain-containing protein [Colletotrichum phormii]KAK1638853.1 DNA-directed RNA polymerase I subunit RPA34.5-domain-containing protein [Colletotrichum phormii]